MSLVKPALNAWLRHTEKRYLAKAADPIELRRSFEQKARLFFFGPRGSKYEAALVASVPVLNVLAAGVRQADGPLILYFHGGAYIFGSPSTHKAMAAQISQRARLPVCLPDYRKAPENSLLSAIEDAVSVYCAVADHPGGVILGGDSAGGGLVLAVNLEIKKQGLPKPLGSFCFSPLTDLSFSSKSVDTNATLDVVLPVSLIPRMRELVLQGLDENDPVCSPIHGDFEGSSPFWICVSDSEILLDQSTLMAERLRLQGVPATLVVEKDLPHVWPIFHNILPEARHTLDDLTHWINSLQKRSDDS